MRKIILAFLGFLAVSCGTNAYANSNCGDKSKGSFKCDSDQISVEYGVDVILNNNWYEMNSLGNFKTAYGTKLDLNPESGKYRFKSVNAFIQVISDGGWGDYPCSNSTSGVLLYKAKLVAKNASGKEVVLDYKDVTRTWNGFTGMVPTDRYPMPWWLSGCKYGTSLNFDFASNTQGEINLSAGNVDSSYTDFQVKITDIYDGYIDPNNNYTPLAYYYGLYDPKTFLNINGFR